MNRAVAPAARVRRPTLLHRLQRSRWLRPVWLAAAWPLALLFLLYSSLIRFTYRLAIGGPGLAHEGPAVYVSWHCYMPWLVPFHAWRRRWLMMSPEPYMRPMVVWARLQGGRIVLGTVAERGRDALAELAERLARGESVVIAVDGPAGPPFRVKRGCVELARLTGAPIIPVSYRSSRGSPRSGRWDSQIIPVPFDRVRLHVGAPMWLGPGDPTDEALRAVAAALDELDFTDIRDLRRRRTPAPAGPTVHLA